MNFHKTIGFLAALLLTLGLGVPDSFAQQTLSISVNPSSLTDTDNATIVTVTADVAGGTANDPVQVNLAHNDGHEEDTTEGTEDFPAVTIPTISITLDADGEGSGTAIFAFDPQTDVDPDDEVIVIEGTLVGVTDTANLTIIDVDSGVATVTLSISPSSVKDTDGATDLQVSVTITMEAPAEADTPVTVTINDLTPAAGTDDYDEAVHAESSDYTFPGTPPTITLNVLEGESSASGADIVEIGAGSDLPTDSDDETILLQAEAGGKRSDVKEFTKTDADVGIASVDLTLKPDNLDEDEDETEVEVTVGVTLNAPASAATTVNVVLTRDQSHADDNAGTDVTVDLLIEDNDDGTDGIQNTNDDDTHTVEVVFAKGNRTKSVKHTITIDPDTDTELDNEVVVLQGVGTVEDADGDPGPFTSTGTVNFTINDTENGVASIVLEVSPTELDDTAGVTALVVTATVNMRKDVDSATSVTVALSVGNEDDDGDTAEDGDYTLTPADASLPDIIVIIPSGSKTGEASVGLSIDPTEDVGDPDSDNEVLALKGTVIQDSESITDVATVTINDATPSGGLTLAVKPDSFSEADGSTTVTITASIELLNSVDADTDVTVSLALDDEDDGHTAESGDYGISTLSDIVVTIPSGKKEGSEEGLFTLDPVVDADTDAEDIVIKGTATVGTTDLSDTATLSITDGVAKELTKNATDADGFRAEITKTLGNNGWVKVGKETVQIRVYRRDIVASEWGNFSSIRVGLHTDDGVADTDDVKHTSATSFNAAEQYALAVQDESDNPQLSNLSLSSVKTDSLGAFEFKGVGNAAGSFPAPKKVNNIIAYTKQSEVHDFLEFRFAIADAANEDDLEKVFAVVTFIAENKIVGQLDGRDTETTIYPENPSLFTNEVVGDGKFIKIDRSKPLADVVTSFTTTIRKGKADAQDAAADVHAGIGAWIKSTATYGDFNHHSVRFQLVGTEDYFVNDEDGNAVKVVAANQLLQGFPTGTKTFVEFDAITVFGSDGSLIDSVQVSGNQFERKYNVAADPDESKARFKKNDWFEDDNVKVLIRAQVLDKAGNAATQSKKSAVFVLDSKPPKVTITYPKPSAPDSSRFTAGGFPGI